MDKNCNSCRHRKGCAVYCTNMGPICIGWDYNEDYCSKWEQKEDKLEEEVYNHCLTIDNADHNFVEIKDTCKFFRALIKECLEKAQNRTCNMSSDTELVILEDILKAEGILDD